MNNEPVAWTAESELDNFRGGSPDICVVDEKDGEFNIPLYTTSQIKDLSDEEIINLAFAMGFLVKEDLTNEWSGYIEEFIAVVKAILKKANEK